LAAPSWLGSVLVVALALVHALGRVPLRNPWRSAAAGASVAYIFLHLMPEIAAAHDGRGLASELPFFGLALLGLVLFHGLEHALRRRERGHGGSGVFRLHVAAFAAYSATIGYLLLHREDDSLAGLILYASAMGLHFLASDSGMRVGHQAATVLHARHMLALAVLAGGGLGLLVQLPRAAVDALFALIAGGVVLNVLKEELPDDRDSHFGGFALGAALYGALLAVVG